MSALVVVSLSAVVAFAASAFHTERTLWSHYEGDVWVANHLDWSPTQVFADGARLLPSLEAPARLRPGTFRFVKGFGLAVNVGSGGPTSHVVAASHPGHGFFVSDHEGVVIEGFGASVEEKKAARSIAHR